MLILYGVPRSFTNTWLLKVAANFTSDSSLSKFRKAREVTVFLREACERARRQLSAGRRRREACSGCRQMLCFRCFVTLLLSPSRGRSQSSCSGQHSP